ncbi:MAG: major outer membrane protein [Campylobacter sp.]|nr:major outer membrane protein [Campylobacter sp.]
MKLTKISLAALVALGAFSSVASATPLEEAIKNVDLSGFARYRYTNDKEHGAVSQKDSSATHNFKFITNFKAAIDDNFFGVIGLRYNASDDSGNKNANTTDKTDTTDKFAVHQFYLGYTIGNTTITAGKQYTATYFDDDQVGTGIRIVNQDIEGLTLTAVAFDALEENDVESDGALHENHTYGSFNAGNLYAAGIAGSYDPINFQLWYASLTNLADLLAVDVDANFDITEDVAIGARINYVNSNVDSDVKGRAIIPDYNDGNFYAGELTTALFGVDFKVGYMGWKAKDHGVTSFSFEDQGQLIDIGELTLDHTLAAGKANFVYGALGYTYDKFFVGVEYLRGNVKTPTKIKYEEITPRLAYQYSKKLEFSSYYAFQTKKYDGDKAKQDELRFEAKYSF